MSAFRVAQNMDDIENSHSFVVDFIRDERKFAGINDLQRAIAVDKEIAVALLD